MVFAFQPKSKSAAMGEAGEEVQLYVYDLTGGMAQVLGQSLLRKSRECTILSYRNA